MFKRLLSRYKTKPICCITLLGDGLAIALFSEKSTPPIKTYFLPAKTEKEAFKLLTDFVLKRKLRKIPCQLILQPQQYRLFYLDAPLVLEEELVRASRWLVKDLIQQPLEDTAIDVIQVPVRAGQTNKMYVVTTPMKDLDRLSTLIKRTGLEVQKITTVELALTHLLSVYPESDRGIALLYWDGKTFRLMIAKAGYLRLVRDVGVLSNLTDVKEQERLILEIQRSLDFYENHFGESIPAKLLVAPNEYGVSDYYDFLNNAFSIPVVKLYIQDSLGVSYETNESVAKNRCFSVVGQALANRSIDS